MWPANAEGDSVLLFDPEDESINMEDMQANEAEVIIRVRKGAKFPEENVPKPLAEAELRWMQDVFDKYYQMTGVSQMRATSRKEPGVEAGVVSFIRKLGIASDYRRAGAVAVG